MIFLRDLLISNMYYLENLDELNLEHGEILVKTAREAIEKYLAKNEIIPVPENVPDILKRRAGVFVTLRRHDLPHDKSLRGCIGYPYPVYPLIEGTIRAAIAAATEDPRFRPVTLDEMNKIVVEVTVLSKPQPLVVSSPAEYLEKVKVGKHGIIVEYAYYSGLLLPQVPIEEGRDVEEFLSYGCLKAGLPPDCRTREGVKISIFEGVIFAEKEPRGEIIKVELKKRSHF